MIWFTLALFVVSFLLTALLTPKPEFENARPQSLDDVDFPRATEDAPIPLVLGKVRFTAPNTIWWGNFSSVAITQKVKTGLFSSKRVTIGHRYFLTLDLALAMGPAVVLREIFLDDKSLWTGTTSATTATSFSSSDSGFFGGHQNGGGWITSNTYYPGANNTTDQPVNGLIEGIVGAGNLPAYLGVAHIVMNGEIGEGAQLRRMAFVLECYTDALGGLPDAGKVGEDMNPAEAIYQIFTDVWRGMGVADADIDLIALRALGVTCHTEGNGVSIKITAETNGAKVIQEILRQVDGIAYQDPATGKIVFELIRADYDIALIPEYDENDVVKITNFSRTGWDEVVAQVKVSFPQRDQESNKVAISQDAATAGMIGRLRSTTLAMPFIYDVDLANQVASRERAQLSVPLFRMTLEMNRNANTLRPGSVFKLNWSDYDFVGLVMRVQEFDFGSLLEGRMVVKCLQDSFALNNVVFGAPAVSGWVAPVTTPLTISELLGVEMPRFYQNQLAFPTPDGNGNLIALAEQPGTASTSFDLAIGNASGDANLDTREPIYIPYAATGELTLEYDKFEGIATGIDTTTDLQVGTISGVFEEGTITEVRAAEKGILYMDGEWLAFTGSTDNLDGTFQLENVYRGLFGSTPKTHAIGTRVWQVTPEHFGTGALDDLGSSSTAYWKVLDRVGAVSKGIETVGEQSLLLTDLADRPVRPRNLQWDGGRTGLDTTLSSDVTVSWSASNREKTDVSIEQDAAEVPDQTETYNVQIYVDGVFNGTAGGSGLTSPYTLVLSAATIAAGDNRELRVYAVRGGKVSSGYAVLPFKVTASGALLSGDEQSGTDKLALSGDMTGGTDNIVYSGDEA